SKVPSPEYAAISSWICSASGNRASRVRMDVLPHGFNFHSGIGDGLPNPCRSGAARYIVDGKHCLQTEAGKEILIKSWIQFTKFLQGQICQLTISFDADLHRIANYFVGQTERNSALHQVGGTGPGVHESGLRCLLHAFVIELRSFHPTRDQGKKREYGTGG